MWPALAIVLAFLAGCESQTAAPPAGPPTGQVEISKAGGEEKAAEQNPADEKSGQEEEASAAFPPAPLDPQSWIRPSDEELSEGWLSLFDGQTLFGWRHSGSADWRVENGAIVVESGEKG
ncbi:MAG: hypothetical protein DYG96_13400, partial [Chlorobi bacterium CHB2]|nr:hypothetical protein [Chlorobi bacterium CHB2]